MTSDRDFFDLLLVGLTATTGAENRYWRPLDDGRIVAVAQDDTELPVAAGLSESDAAWITAIHGCLPDLVRRLHQAVDESDRLDLQVDELTGRIAELEREILALRT
jgi:hypothetical protein